MLSLLLSCSTPPETPWEDATPTSETISGHFRVELGSSLPGAGWFASDTSTGRDAARGWVIDEVLVIQVYGHQAAGWDVLELDAALRSWSGPNLPFDGTFVTGQLQTADGEIQYLVDGYLEVVSPGLQNGDIVEADFSDVVLAR